MTNVPIIKIEQLEKSFGDLHVLKGIDLEVNRGEVVCIIGPNIPTEAVIVRCIRFLLFSVHNDLCSPAVNEHVC